MELFFSILHHYIDATPKMKKSLIFVNMRSPAHISFRSYFEADIPLYFFDTFLAISTVLLYIGI